LLALLVAGAALPSQPSGAPPARQPSDSRALELANGFYAGRPREERPQAGWQTVPEGLSSLSAGSCGECHTEIYQEWRVSTHAQAWTDRQFQSEIAKSGNRWLCRNCHTPLLNQMPVWAVGLEAGDVELPVYVDNPDVDLELRAEGITCAGCHVRDGFIEGPTGVRTAAHPTRLAERFSDETICLSCHQAVRSYPGKDFVCVFETGEEWREGPYSRHRCQFCHMQAVVRPQAVGAPARAGRRHYWPGAGIYKVPGLGPPLDQLGFGLGIDIEATDEALIVRLSNAAAGHKLPSGDPERHILVEVMFADGAGRALGEPYRIRIGQTWEWWPEPRKLDDNRLAPLEERLEVIARPPGAASWSLIASSHRISREALEYHELEGYPASRVTHRLGGRLRQAVPEELPLGLVSAARGQSQSGEAADHQQGRVLTEEGERAQSPLGSRSMVPGHVDRCSERSEGQAGQCRDARRPI
jgi:hypothetical protein